jgi:hypothetical protein
MSCRKGLPDAQGNSSKQLDLQRLPHHLEFKTKEVRGNHRGHHGVMARMNKQTKTPHKRGGSQMSMSDPAARTAFRPDQPTLGIETHGALLALVHLLARQSAVDANRPSHPTTLNP